MTGFEKVTLTKPWKIAAVGFFIDQMHLLHTTDRVNRSFALYNMALSYYIYYAITAHK